MDKFSTEKKAVQIALLLSRYKTVHWSLQNIMLHVGGSTASIEDALKWMRKKKYIDGRESVFLTSDGCEFVDGLRVNTSLHSASSESNFKNEALTGLTERRNPNTGTMISEQSTMMAAVIPNVKKPTTNTTPEDLMVERQRAIKSKLYLCRTLNLTNEQLEHYIEVGRVRYCKRCSEIGVFDRKGSHRWQPVCRKCRKQERKS